MVEKHIENTKRVARNTALLYLRTIVMMLISLFTSRIVLEALGVDNYGINNVVGGVVGMFSIISGSLSGSISRFLTYALGEENKEKLRKVFSMSINIQIFIGIIILILAESCGIWFINQKLNIPSDRLIAAHWVFQCSLISFFIALINIPYNACLIAHERMNVFAYMTILDVSLKLLTAYAIFISPFDKLITFAVLNVFVGIIMRIIYGIYCVRNFEECHYERTTFDKKLAKEMTGFAWWGFLGNTAWIFNTQGVNILINMFFGVIYNAARGVAAQIEGAVMGFVGNFMTALNPQITKSYAAGDKEYLFSLICRGTKFAYFLTLLFAIPLWFEAQTVLSIWLVEVPEDSAVFLKLSLICAILTTSAQPLLTAILATGNIRKYEIVTTLTGCLVFPITYIAYKFGCNIFATYYIYMVVYTFLIWVKILFAKKLIEFKPIYFFNKVVVPSFLTTLIAFICPVIIYLIMPDDIFRLIIITLLSIVWVSISIYFFGLTNGEQKFIKEKLLSKLNFARSNQFT